ncbi:AAA family ATPase [Bacillus mobilis]|uniref:AAA family ATPase n=1 Tax=Bacillus mobilis TaxID=2026190 RepID=UPI002E208391|nr:AAA family ATPase [Bacillus mobilis]
MRFYISGLRGTNLSYIYPCVVLKTSEWDDYSYRTSFYASYFPSRSVEKEIGNVKILRKTYDGDFKEDNPYRYTCEYMEDSFLGLDGVFCSLGQSLDYYFNLKKLGDRISRQILQRLNDVAVNDDLRTEFEQLKGFQDSLIRFSNAEKAFKEAKQYFGGRIEKQLNFQFTYKLENASEPHVVDLNFEKSELPYRINAFVGKNATGKTKILTELASQVSGIKMNKDNFYPKRPSFDMVIALSYSAFDELFKPFEEEFLLQMEDKGEIENKNDFEKENKRQEESILFSYVYCGLRTSKGILSIDQIEHNFLNAYQKVIDRGREERWEKILRNVLEDEHFELIDLVRTTKVKSEAERVHKLSEFLSSGQSVLLSTMTEVIANIEYDSLILFDEPEIHLHPNAIANFMRMFYEILNEFESYAVISTHSPLILQEIPSRYIKVFNRFNNTPSIETPFIECFGENISNITNDVFEVREYESNYKTYLRRLSKSLDKEEIIELFDGDLSFNTLTYLSSLSHQKERGEE